MMQAALIAQAGGIECRNGVAAPEGVGASSGSTRACALRLCSGLAPASVNSQFGHRTPMSLAKRDPRTSEASPSRSPPAAALRLPTGRPPSPDPSRKVARRLRPPATLRLQRPNPQTQNGRSERARCRARRLRRRSPAVPRSRAPTLRDNPAVNERTVTAVWLWCIAASVALWLLVAWTVGLVV